MEDRRCQYCGRRLHPALRRDAKFCDRTCKSNEHRYRKEHPEPPPNPNQIFCRTPEEYVPLANTIYQAAPRDATGYLLRKHGCSHGNGALVFPVPARRTKHADGTLRSSAAYALFPFEIPRVPWEGLYELHFLTPTRGWVVPEDPSFQTIQVRPAVPRAAFDEGAVWRWVPPDDDSDTGSAAYLEREMLSRAPMRAIGYMLHTSNAPHGPGLFEFPVRDRVTRRASGARTSLPYYELNPFEPPLVPWAGIYQLTFRIEHGIVYCDPELERRLLRVGYIHPFAEYERSDRGPSAAALPSGQAGALGLLQGSSKPRVVRRKRLVHR